MSKVDREARETWKRNLEAMISQPSKLVYINTGNTNSSVSLLNTPFSGKIEKKVNPNKYVGCGARSYTKTETHYECDYCGNKYHEL